MSYKFNLDHTLAIADIHDMITIDIKPETRCMVAGGDVQVHGYLTFRGSYLTPELGEAPFEGSIPVDITLPYLGGAPDVQPEVVSFDYRIASKESLTLSLEVSLNGYHVKEERDKVMDAWVDPVVEEPVYEEAVIEPFEFDMVEPINDLTEDEPVVEVEIREEVVVERLEEPIEEEVHEVHEVPYSPLVEIQERVVEATEIQFEANSALAEDPEPVVEVVVEPQVKEEVIPVVEEIAKRAAPKMTDSAAALMEELFAMKRGTAFKEKAKLLEETTNEEEVLSAAVEEDEVDGAFEVGSVGVAQTVARQFADGETTIKMVYVDHESQTLGGVLERYEATLDDVWNLAELGDGVSVGDCVLLRYEKTI